MMNWFAVNDRQAVQVPDHALLGLELREHVGHDRRTLVRRVGARRPAVGEAGQVRASSRRTSRPANLGKYKTPMLVIHNDLDFRCPIGQGHELFTRAAAAGRAVAVRQLPRRGPLGAEAEEQRVLAQGSVRLAREVRPAGREVTLAGRNSRGTHPRRRLPAARGASTAPTPAPSARSAASPRAATVARCLRWNCRWGRRSSALISVDQVTGTETLLRPVCVIRDALVGWAESSRPTRTRPNAWTSKTPPTLLPGSACICYRSNRRTSSMPRHSPPRCRSA